jgi:hypothetical protein
MNLKVRREVSIGHGFSSLEEEGECGKALQGRVHGKIDITMPHSQAI